MRQQPIDLLPEAIRTRSHAGVVTGRYVVATLLALVLLGLTVTHSRLMLDLARQRLRVAEEQADIVLRAEARAEKLRTGLRESQEYIRRYELLALPVDFTRVVATVVNVLPASATLDRIDIDAGPRRSNRSTRGRGQSESEGPPSRELVGELSGFAATDQDIAQLVFNLQDLEFFDRVSLDFSRTRSVRGHNAREFRISFTADLDARYEVTDLAFAAGDRHVQ